MDVNNYIISVPKAAKLVDISEELLRYYIVKGKTPKPLIFDGRKYFLLKEIKKWKKPKPEKTGRKPMQ
jgi:hypothetical protein